MTTRFILLQKNLGAFPARSAGNRAIRSNLFYRFAVKKDFRYYPWRAPSDSPRICCRKFAGQPGRMGLPRNCPASNPGSHKK
jgi:hypothetical protein